MASSILIVEDDPELREMLAQLLTLEGFHPLHARHGREALDLLQHEPKPAVIVLDLMMPVMDGWAFLRARQEETGLAAIPVMVVSAVADLQADELGASVVINKPYNFDLLIATLRRLLRG